jgi:hypothetical protein
MQIKRMYTIAPIRAGLRVVGSRHPLARWPAGPLARWPAGPLTTSPAGPLASGPLASGPLTTSPADDVTR